MYCMISFVPGKLSHEWSPEKIFFAFCEDATTIVREVAIASSLCY